jgi:iron complex transport system substrate-binding protein
MQCRKFTLAFLLLLCPSLSTAAPKLPLVIENCNMQSTYLKAPQRAVVINQNPVEIMLALGLEEQMLGTAYLDDAILPSLEAAYKRVPVLAEKYPSKEKIISLNADFIYAGFGGAYTDKTVGTREELLALGINPYLTPTYCFGQREQPVYLDEVWQEILDIGRIFQVEERAEALAKDLQQKIEQVQQRIGQLPKKRVFLFNTWGTNEDVPYTSGCCGIVHLLLELAGGENIFADIQGPMGHVNWEAVIDRDPELIVLDDAWWSPAERKKNFLLSHPALAEVSAVKNKRFVAIPASGLMPGVRVADTVQQLAAFFYPETHNLNE